jgi:hypothetical protein
VRATIEAIEAVWAIDPRTRIAEKHPGLAATRLTFVFQHCTIMINSHNVSSRNKRGFVGPLTVSGRFYGEH